MIDLATTVRLRRSALDTMLAHACEASGRECCGALVGRTAGEARCIERAVPAPNADPDPLRAYVLDAATIRRIEREAAAEGLDVVGFYHSHPDGSPVPSSVDLGFAWPWFTYLIVGDARAREVSAWRLRPDRSAFDAEELEWVE